MYGWKWLHRKHSRTAEFKTLSVPLHFEEPRIISRIFVSKTLGDCAPQIFNPKIGRWRRSILTIGWQCWSIAWHFENSLHYPNTVFFRVTSATYACLQASSVASRLGPDGTGGSSNPWASMPYRLDTTVALKFFVPGSAFGPPSCRCEVCERHDWNLEKYFASLNRCPNVVGWQPCGRKRVWPPKILLRMIAMAAAWKVYLHGKLLLQMSFHSRSPNGGRPFQGDEVGYSATKARRRKRVLLFSIPNYCRDNAITMCSCLKHLLYLRRSLLPMLSNVVRTCFFNVFFTCFVPDTHVWTRWILSKNHICWEVKKNIQLPRGSKPLCRKREAEEGSQFAHNLRVFL